MNDVQEQRGGEEADTAGHGLPAPAPFLVGGGRVKGQSNFKADEDIKLATAYTVVALDAAVGTDQDGSTLPLHQKWRRS